MNTLEIKGLKTHINTDSGLVRAVDGVDLVLEKGEVLGLVGESGCGKTILSLSIMNMLPNDARIIEGDIFFCGNRMRDMGEEELRKLRGPGISMIFQDPMTSLNPVFSIEDQLTMPLLVHEGISKNEARKEALEMLKKVGIPSAENRMKQYPHQFSGGQRQRIMIAMALSLNPDLLIADEPTTALDVSIQAQILKLLQDLQSGYQTSMIFVSHNLGIISEIAGKVAVMYAGWIVEEAPVDEIFKNPVHPYTRALLEAIPTIRESGKQLKSLGGQPPVAGENLEGCRLHPRCPVKIPGLCDSREPPFFDKGDKHRVKCFRADLERNST